MWEMVPLRLCVARVEDCAEKRAHCLLKDVLMLIVSLWA